MSHRDALSSTRAEVNFVEKRTKETKELRAEATKSQSRMLSRQDIERYRCEGVLDPKDDKRPHGQAPRRRRRRSSCASVYRPPTPPSPPIPYRKHADETVDGKKGVRFSEPLEQRRRQRSMENHSTSSKGKSALKKTDSGKKKDHRKKEEEEDEEESTPVRRFKPSSIPESKNVPNSEPSVKSKLPRHPTPFPITSTDAPQSSQDSRQHSCSAPQDIPKTSSHSRPSYTGSSSSSDQKVVIEVRYPQILIPLITALLTT